MTPTPPDAGAATDGPVTLDNCEREPIHIPGSIQPHGVLFAFDAGGRLTHLSANAAAMLGFAPPLGAVPSLEDLGGHADLLDHVQAAVAEAGASETWQDSQAWQLGDASFDVVLHAGGGVAVVELERRTVADDEVTRFSLKAHRSMERLKRQRSIEALLETAVADVRAMTGFDRVMAYRFHPDDSGEVVTEARRDDLDAYAGRRYPASDIPAQARRLYLLNTLRLIADIRYRPVPLLASPGHAEPLDLSHAVLRSVSPIHIEYLSNMGVSASMSVSIVVGGRLWGMLACHHMGPLQVPYSLRMASDVIAQLIASSVQSIEARGREQRMAAAAALRSDIATLISQDSDAIDALHARGAELRDILDAEALLLSFQGRHRSIGAVDAAWADELVAWLDARLSPLVVATSLAELPPGQRGSERYCGVLAFNFDRQQRGWVVALRREQVETIRWAGQPDKVLQPGPLGPRLTPRGSFDEWRQTVRDTARAWTPTELDIASLQLDAVARAHAARVLELDRIRSRLWAVLGHDMRDPLQSLRMASTVIDRGGMNERMGSVIRNSTHRMQRMLNDLQDITRVQNGLGLALAQETVDVVPLLRALLRDAEVAYPDAPVEAALPATAMAHIDAGRYLQVVSNLLSNARHHGTGPAKLQLVLDDDAWVLSVRNPGKPIEPDRVVGLFDPFKRAALVNPDNPSGMGLGLYIADQIARAHGGSLRYEGHADGVTFSLVLKRRREN